LTTGRTEPSQKTKLLIAVCRLHHRPNAARDREPVSELSVPDRTRAGH
jgi:hypothetical protein